MIDKKQKKKYKEVFQEDTFLVNSFSIYMELCDG